MAALVKFPEYCSLKESGAEGSALGYSIECKKKDFTASLESSVVRSG